MCSVFCRSCLYYAVEFSFCADALVGILRKVFIIVPVTIYFVWKGAASPYCLFSSCGVEEVLVYNGAGHGRYYLYVRSTITKNTSDNTSYFKQRLLLQRT